MVIAIIAFQDVFKDLGFSDAIISKRLEVDQSNLLFSIQLLLACISYFLLFILVFVFDNMADHKQFILLMCLVFFTNCYVDTFILRFRYNNDYKLLSIRQLLASLISGALGLLFAYKGFGEYALLIGFMAGQFFSMLFLFGFGGKVRLQFDFGAFFMLFKTAKHVVIQRLSGFLVGQADSLIISSQLGLDRLGIYRLSHQITNLIPYSTLALVGQVLFSEFADQAKKNSYASINKSYKIYTVICGIGLFLFSVIFVLYAEKVITTVLGDKWVEMSSLVCIISTGLATGFMCSPNSDLAKILGFESRYTAYTLIRGIISALCVLLSAAYGIKFVVIAWVAVSIFFNIINEVLFNSSQSLIKLMKYKSVLYSLNIIWAVYVMNANI